MLFWFMVSIILSQLSGILHTLFVLLGRLVNYSTMFQTPEIEHSYAAICSATHKYINAVGAESDVENFFVMGDELCFSG